MRERSENWKSITSDGRFKMQVKAIIGETEYTSITAPNIEQSAVTDSIKIGNCVTGSLKFSVMTEDVIPKGAKVVIQARVTKDETTFSEWKEFGTFYISKRQADNGLISFECYDSMVKASQPYIRDNDTLNWPKTQQACAEEIAERIGVELDSRTAIGTGDEYKVTYPQDLTMLQVLSFIAVCNGGNWIITPENKLRLIKMISSPSGSFEDLSSTTNATNGKAVNVPVVTDKITTGKYETISKVTLIRDDNVGYTAGDDTGTELKISGNPYVNQSICNNLYEALNGAIYSPFTATNAIFDPCAELGDWIFIGEQVKGVLYKQSVTLDNGFSADIESPGKDETEDEFPYPSKIEQLQEQVSYITREGGQIDTKIKQSQEAIEIYVKKTYATQESVEASIKVIGENISSKVSKDELSSEILQKSDEIRLSASKITWKSDNSSLTEDGTLTAQNVDIKGTVNATSGTFSGTVNANEGSIGGWSIGKSNKYPNDSVIYKSDTIEGVGYEVGLKATFGSENYANFYVSKKQDDNWRNVLWINNKGELTSDDGTVRTVVGSGEISFVFQSDSGIGKVGVIKTGSITEAFSLESRYLCIRAKTGGSGLLLSSAGDIASTYLLLNDPDVDSDFGLKTSHVFSGIARFVNRLVCKDSIYTAKNFLIYKNDQYLYGKTTDGTSQRLIGISSANNVVVGHTSNVGNLKILAKSNKTISLEAGTVKANDTTLATGSDARIKNSITGINEKYEKFFGNLRPVTFRYNNGQSGRRHVGFVAQEVLQALEKSGLTSQDFAGYVRAESDIEGLDGYELLIRYSEFTALNTFMIQKLLNEISSLKERINQ